MVVRVLESLLFSTGLKRHFLSQSRNLACRIGRQNCGGGSGWGWIIRHNHVVASNSLFVPRKILTTIKFCFRLSTEESLPSVTLPVLTPTVGSNVKDITFSKRKCIRLREVGYLQTTICYSLRFADISMLGLQLVVIDVRVCHIIVITCVLNIEFNDWSVIY